MVSLQVVLADEEVEMATPVIPADILAEGHLDIGRKESVELAEAVVAGGASRCGFGNHGVC